MSSAWHALAEDLAQLARLHHAEIDAPLLAALRENGFPAGLALRLGTADAAEATRILRHGIEDPTPTLDDLAADFAAIYLTSALHASPMESVWLDEEGLAMQGPMFEVRACYREQGFQTADWRQRPDDHLVTQLEFCAALLRMPDGDGLRPLARFLDDHTLRWVGPFSQRVSARCATALYAGLNLLTSAYLEELRDLLAQSLDEPRPTAEQQAARRERPRPAAPVDAPYVPGVAPSW